MVTPINLLAEIQIIQHTSKTNFRHIWHGAVFIAWVTGGNQFKAADDFAALALDN